MFILNALFDERIRDKKRFKRLLQNIYLMLELFYKHNPHIMTAIYGSIFKKRLRL